MYTVDHCPACHSMDVTKQPAYLAQFVVWKATNEFVYNNQPTNGVTCNKCGFVGSSLRLTEEEEVNLYRDYRGEEYTNKRIFCEAWYKDYIADLDHTDYAQGRKIGINKLLDKHIDHLFINTVLDYGGDTGEFIPERFIKSKRYVYDISEVELLPGILKFNPNLDKTKMDFVMCCHVLEHKSDPDMLIKDIKRYSNKGGWIYLEVPNFDAPQLPGGLFHEHLNIWKTSSVQALLERHNIDIIDSLIEFDYLCILARQR